MLRIRSFLFLPALLALLCTTALASIATPPSGTPINLLVGNGFPIKLKNAQGCTFDYTVTVDDPQIVEVSSSSGTGVKGATIQLTGLKFGMTMVTINSSGGTCPVATHTYPVTVDPNTAGLFKSYTALTKGAANDVKLDIKLGFSSYNDTLKTLGVDYKLGNLTNDQLQDGFHLAADTLRQTIYGSGVSAYSDVILGGTTLLSNNGLSFGDAPIDLFAGGCGDFDTFQNSVCGQFAKTHDTFTKASKKGVTSFVKLGAPKLGQWSILPPLYAGGPVFDTQLGSIVAPPPLMGPLTITTRPTGTVGDTGRLRVSGMGATSRSGQLEVKLTRTLDGQLPWTMTLTPTIVSNEWTATFGSLAEGAYSLDTRYSGDAYGVTLSLSIAAQF